MERCRYCPSFLLSFLRRARASTGHVLADAEYDVLAELLLSTSSAAAAHGKLEQFVSGYFAARDKGIHRKGMWPYAGLIVLVGSRKRSEENGSVPIDEGHRGN